MKTFTLLIVLLSFFFSSYFTHQEKNYVFFLHNRFVETHELNEAHPQYGIAEYNKIIQTFKDNGLTVISEKRGPDVNIKDYALKVKKQIDSLLSKGIPANHITVIGTSKGGYIAQYVSTYAENPDLNFVFIACYNDRDIKRFPDINFCGNILTIYEKTDPLGVSALKRKETSSCKIKNFKEIELNTGLKHGFQFKALKEWIEPSVQWAKRNYQLN